MTWKPLAGFESTHEVSTEGSIRRFGGREITLQVSPGGYAMAQFRVGGKKLTLYVHRLVARTFLGEPPSPTAVVNHLDGNRSNNHLGNLQWCSKSENSLHGVARRRAAGQFLHPASKLTADDAWHVRMAAIHCMEEVGGCAGMARALSVSPMTIHDIVRGNTWRHVGFP